MRSTAPALLLAALVAAGCADQYVEIDGLRCRTEKVRGVAVDLQVPEPSAEDARDQAIQSANLPTDGWVLVHSDGSKAEFRLEPNGRPVARIELRHVTIDSGYPMAGWTVAGVAACADLS